MKSEENCLYSWLIISSKTSCKKFPLFRWGNYRWLALWHKCVGGGIRTRFCHITTHWYTIDSAAAAAAKSLQSCLTLCDPIDSGSPGSPVPGILQARTLEWVAICFSNAWKGKVKVKSLSRVRLFATPWTAVYQAPPSMRFSRQEYWSGVPLPSPVDSARSLKI